MISERPSERSWKPVPLFPEWRGWLARVGVWAPLEGDLESGHEERVRCAVYSLGRIRRTRSVRLLSRTIERRELPASLRALAASQLGRLGLPECCAALCAALEDIDPEVRCEACDAAFLLSLDALGDLRSRRWGDWRESGSALCESLSRAQLADAEGSVRAAAKDALEYWPQRLFDRERASPAVAR